MGMHGFKYTFLSVPFLPIRSPKNNKKSEILIYVGLRWWHVFQCVTESEIGDIS